MTEINRYIDKKLDNLLKSKFRSSFHLKDKDIEYIKSRGMNIIRNHAYDFVKQRLSNAVISNDGKQTPMRGHPVFISQHATATCCRGCLYKWHNIKPGHKLTNREIDYVVKVIMAWINREYDNK